VGKDNENNRTINLTPFIPLSLIGEGELALEEGLTPLLNTPLSQN